MRRNLAILCVLPALAIVLLGQAEKKKKGGYDRYNQPVGYSDTPVIPEQKWKVHDIERPRPRQITPGALPMNPPSDAIVLLDGKDLSQWEFTGKRGNAPKSWKLENGYMEVVGGAGDARTKEKFGDMQLHIEWASPAEVLGNSQMRGNSGVLLMGRYEIQVLDSWENPTYADGQAGAIYGQWSPLVNAIKKRGEWNYYDIVFEAPKFEGEKLVKNPYVTVFHNGVLLHHRQKMIGPMAHRIVAPFRAHGPEEPLMLQDHNEPVRYRNIWARKLRGYDEP
jgi:hypothetical protein